MVYAALCIGIVGASFGVPSLAFLHQKWGFIPFIAVIGCIQIIYGLFFFKRTPNAWIGGISAAMILALVNIGIIHNSGQLHSWYLIAWFIQVIAGGMYGMYSIIGCGFLVTIYYLLTATGIYGRQLIDPIAIGAVLGSYLACLIAYLLWRNMYQATESLRVNQLAGQLQSKQLQTEVLIQSISDGMIVVDTEGQISLLNPAAAKMTGWPIEEALGISVTTVTNFSEEDGKEIAEDEDPFRIVTKSKQPLEKIVQITARDGKTRHVVSLAISPILSGNDELSATVAVIRDVSAAREEEHRRADFISTASHEMRTPVAAIEGYLQLALNEKVAKIDPKAREYLTKSLESTHRLGTLFQDLLTSAKAEDGRLVSHPRVVEMGEYLETITDGLKFAAEKKGLLVDFTVGSGSQEGVNKMVKPLYYAMIDPDRMQEVITNLFDNAVKYSEKGKVTIALTGNDQVVQFFVRDNGHGIPAEDVPHLFQKFYRVDNSSTRTVGGTGLGLFICRKIVELYNGRIWVESELSKGSTFYINLPRLSNQKATELQASQAQQTT